MSMVDFNRVYINRGDIYVLILLGVGSIALGLFILFYRGAELRVFVFILFSCGLVIIVRFFVCLIYSSLPVIEFLDEEMVYRKNDSNKFRTIKYRDISCVYGKRGGERGHIICVYRGVWW